MFDYEFITKHSSVIGPYPLTCLKAQVNTKLCDNFSVGHYPMLFWGPPSKFVSAGWEPNQAKGDIRVIDDGRTADRLLSWINKQLGRYEVFTFIVYLIESFSIEYLTQRKHPDW